MNLSNVFIFMELTRPAKDNGRSDHLLKSLFVHSSQGGKFASNNFLYDRVTFIPKQVKWSEIRAVKKEVVRIQRHFLLTPTSPTCLL